jgi:hypothetical protein
MTRRNNPLGRFSDAELKALSPRNQRFFQGAAGISCYPHAGDHSRKYREFPAQSRSCPGIEEIQIKAVSSSIESEQAIAERSRKGR